jgi:maltose alpha-D-glucosyltransferase/alpha-amylase
MNTTIREDQSRKIALEQAGGSQNINLAENWTEIFSGPGRAVFSDVLKKWLPSKRWFRSKARAITSVNITEQIRVPTEGQEAFLLLFQVKYQTGAPEKYVLPVACAFGSEAEEIKRSSTQLIVAPVSLTRKARDGVIYDAIVSKTFGHALLALTAKRQTMSGKSGDLESEPTEVLRRIRREQGLNMEPKISKAEQSNSSIIYESSVMLKFFRRLDAGTNPELEIERFLSKRDFPYSPQLAGALEYRDQEGATSTMAVLTSFIPGCHDAWEDTLVALSEFYDMVSQMPAPFKQASASAEAETAPLRHSAQGQSPGELLGSYLQDAETLGQRTASLHLTLASDSDDPAFRPEPWTQEDQQALFESARVLTRHNFELLRQRLASLPTESQGLGSRVEGLQDSILCRFERILQHPINAVRIRTHGDYHLGQVLHHGPDFLIIDFEGEPAISLEERRRKQSALRDVAGMIYSFFYAAHAALREQTAAADEQVQLENQLAWARYWSVWVGTNYLRSYLKTAGEAPFVPENETALKIMLDVELLRKAIYELGYELNNRPEWASIAFRVLLDLHNPDNLV